MKRLICNFLIFFFASSYIYAQEIKGVITDDKGLSLPGVNIVNLQTKKNVVSDLDGKFLIQAQQNETLQFSFIGFETITRKATPNMQIVMKEEGTDLKEVVVIGYGSKKAGSITGSIVQIKADDIVKTPSQNAIQAIQGKAAGVNIVSNDDPGGKPTIQIRGLGTVLSGREPLYVIDGVEATGLNGLSANDIQSLDILKDASSLAIYGNKGANGVIMVTTKKGKIGKLKVSYDSNFGIKQIQRKVEMADAYRFAYYNNTALGSSSHYNLNPNTNTNWLDEITGTGMTSNNAISFSGGSENINYYLSASNYTEKGILNGTSYERTNLSSRNEYKLLDNRVKLTQNINISSSKATPKPTSAFTNAYRQAPIMPVRYDNGTYAWPLLNSLGYNDMSGEKYNDAGNPVAQLDYTNEENKFLTLSGNIGAEIKLAEGLKFNSNFGATFDWQKGYSFTPNGLIYLTANPGLDESSVNYPKQYNTLEQRRIDSYVWNWDNYFTYTKTFNKHKITAVAGMSRSTRNNTETLKATRYNVPEKSNYWSLDLSTNLTDTNPNTIIGNDHSTPIVSLAYFGRAEYEFDNKYLISASIRREGASNFLEAKRWANFPAISAGWVVSNEAFFEKVKFINYFKIRGGYGEVGNAIGTPSVNNTTFSNNYNYLFGSTVNSGYSIKRQIDPNLTWESMNEVDLGFDFKFLSNRLSATLDLYSRKTKDIILPVQYPSVLSPEEVYTNAGDVTNKGVELSLHWDDKINDNLRYAIGGNVSYNKNEISKIYNPFFKNLTGGDFGGFGWTKEFHEGDPLGSFYVYETKGYNSDGSFIYSDKRVNAGSYIPKYTYGLNLSVYYKNFDFSTDLYGVGGNKIYNGKKAARLGALNIEAAELDDFWLPSNTNAANPKPSIEKKTQSTYYVEDGSYLRINNITIGYTLPKFFNKIDKMRIYATAVNPFLFTKYTGFSPEISGSDGGDPTKTAGIEIDAYPTNKTYSIGLNVSF